MPEQGFPNSPAVNDTTILNGMTYKFNGSAWDKVAGAVSTEIPFATQVDLDAAVAVSTTQTGDIAGLTTAMGNETTARTTEQAAQDTLITSLQSSMATKLSITGDGSQLTGVTTDVSGKVDKVSWNHASGSIGTFNEETDIGSVSIGAVSGIDGSAMTATSSDIPVGLSLSSSGAITGSMPNNPATATSNFTVSVTDGTNTETRSFSVTNTADNDAPIWTTASGALSQAGPAAYSVQLSATDPEGGSIAYSVNSGSLPTGLSMDSSGLISGTATLTGSSYSFTIRATDAASQTVDRTFTILAQYPLGLYSSNPGSSAAAILADNASNSDGTYWIKIGANAPHQIYCDMTNGGYMLAGKIPTQNGWSVNEPWAYDNGRWTDSATWQPDYMADLSTTNHGKGYMWTEFGGTTCRLDDAGDRGNVYVEFTIPGSSIGNEKTLVQMMSSSVNTQCTITSGDIRSFDSLSVNAEGGTPDEQYPYSNTVYINRQAGHSLGDCCDLNAGCRIGTTTASKSNVSSGGANSGAKGAGAYFYYRDMHDNSCCNYGLSGKYYSQALSDLLIWIK